MKKFWKSFGWFWMSVLPMVLSLVLQLLLGGVVMAVYGIVLTIKEQAGEIYAQQEFMEAFMKNMLQGAGTGVFAYHVVGVGIFGLWYYLLCYRKKQFRQKWTAVLNGKATGLAVLLGISMCVFTTQLVQVASYLVPQIINDFYRLMEQVGIGSSGLLIVATVLLAPIGEELLCRGVIQYYAGKVSRRFWIVNIIQALMFGIMHGNLVQGFYAFLIGLVLGWLRYKYDSLLIPMVIHFVLNFSTTFWLGQLLDQLPKRLWVDGLVLLAAMGVTAAGLVLVEKSVKKPSQENHNDNLYDS